MNSNTTISLGFYSDTAMQVFRRLEVYICNNTYYPCRFFRNPDGEITDDGMHVYGYAATEKKAYIARHLRKMCIKDGSISAAEFKLDNDAIIKFAPSSKLNSVDNLSVPAQQFKVKELAFAYSILMNQKRAVKSISEFKDFIGMPRDPIYTALETVKLNKKREIEEKYEKLNADLLVEHNKKLDALYAERRDKQDILTEEMEKEIVEMELEIDRKIASSKNVC